MVGVPLPPGKKSQYELNRPGTPVTGPTKFDSNRPGTTLPSSSYSNVKEERKQLLIQAAANGQLTTSQAQELKNSGVSVSPNPNGNGFVVTEQAPPNYGERQKITETVSIRTQENPTYSNVVEERNKVIAERNRELALQPGENAVDKFNRENNNDELKTALVEGRVSANTQGTIIVRDKQQQDQEPTNQEIVNAPLSMNAVEEKPFDFTEYAREQSARIEYSKNQEPYGAKQAILGTESFVLAAVAGFSEPILHPIRFISKTIDFGKNVIFHPFETGYSFTESAIQRPSQTSGELVGNYAFFKTPGLIKAGYVVVGSKYVAAEKVFDVEVLEGKSVFPETTSVKQSLKEFNTPNAEGKVIVQTSSPAKLSGDVAGVGKKASLGLEDPGIYVTPEGRGSPVFTGVFGDAGYEYTLNPFKGSLGVPSVTRFEVKNVVQYPRGVINKQGFEAVGQYQEEVLSGQQVAVITKRSEIGQGNIPGKDSPGTTEIEAAVPKGAQFEYTPKTVAGKIKGFDEYTTLNGKPVAIRDARLVGKGEEVPEGSSMVSRETILSGGESLSSVGTRRVSPSPVVSSFKIIKSSPSSYPSRVSSTSKVGSSSRLSSSHASSVPSYASSPISSKTSSYPSTVSSHVSSSIGRSSSSSIKSLSSSSKIASSSSKFSGSGYSSTVVNGPRVVTPTSVGPHNFRNNDVRGSFNVEVRRGGVFRTVASGVGLKTAFKVGKEQVGNSAAASFKVTPVNERARLELEANKGMGLGRGLYESKKEPGVIIERPSARIKSRGELEEITFKGIASQKKKVRGGLNFG